MNLGLFGNISFTEGRTVKSNKNTGALPATLKRSDKKAQDTYKAVLDKAEDEYKGDEALAHRVAWSAVKHTHKKVGDHWSRIPHKISAKK
jgi:cation transport regulator ChaB